MGGFDKNNPKFKTLTVTDEVRSSNPLFGVVSIPCGVIIPWISGVFSNNANGGFQNKLGSGNGVSEANAHLNSKGFYVCDGSEINLPNSPIFNGINRFLPNLTDDRFISGGSTCGSYGGSNTTESHTHTFNVSVTVNNHASLALNNHSDLSHSGMSAYFNANVFNSLQNAHAHKLYDIGWDGDNIFISTGAHGNVVTNTSANVIGGATASSKNRRYNSPTESVSHSNFISSNVSCSVTQPSTHSSISHSFSTNISTHSVSGNGDSVMTPQAAENRPKYLSIIYLMKVI